MKLSYRKIFSLRISPPELSEIRLNNATALGSASRDDQEYPEGMSLFELSASG
jgi:hypothetical protein